MKSFKLLNAPLVISLCASLSFAQTSSETFDSVCLSGSAQNRALSKVLDQKMMSSSISAKMSLKYLLLSPPSGTESKALEHCAECMKGQTFEMAQAQRNNFKQFDELTKKVKNPDERTFADTAGELPAAKSPTPLFKFSCVATATKIQAGSKHILCPQGSFSANRYDHCTTEKMVNYQNAVITDFYRCAQAEAELPILPETLFDMYANESGFKSNYSHVGGTGSGQLTSIFINDIHQAHRGRPILKSIATSSKPECDIAQKIAEKDLAKKPSFGNKCNFVEYGEGFERNVLYTMIGFANIWKKDISPLMNDYIKKHKDSPDLKKAQSLALLNAYGSGGRAAARAAIRQLSRLNPTDFVKQIQQPLISANGRDLTSYLQRTRNKQSQLANLFKGPAKEEFKKGSQTCVN